ncbi:S8 family serine peptidase [Winogradskyella pacifica]|uniref:S8 family serine peptidase n=1 Tax=Winogradskyella pacifica TaxID=664642 RepID=UPI0015C83F6E|nr:S8 family serine peptidase [Winogradskyella pacifica]
MKNFYIYVFLLMNSYLLLAQTPEERAVITSSYDLNKSKEVMQYLKAENAEREIRIHNYLKTLTEEELAEINLNGLRDITPNGQPLFYVSHNLGSAKTIKADRLNTGGSLGLDLNGQNMIAGVWEAENGYPLGTHLDLAGRITVIDGGSNVSFHATHVTGTIISSGASIPINLGRGIAFEASVLAASSANDTQEMLAQATLGLLVSNHSYGYGAENLAVSRFGAYGSDAFNVDLITNINPYYVPVVSAGNDRDGFSSYNPSKGGYDLLTGQSVAKNAITSAAVGQVLNYTDPTSVVMSSFSNWGPTDDGRIKPDISSKGVGVMSTSNQSNTSYGNSSGTSMSAPATTGLLLLMQQHYNNVNSQYMLAATAKGLLLHTADEAGFYPGPDYSFGWGLANGEKAVETITNNMVSSYIQESSLNDSEVKTFEVRALGNEPLMVSISWTDPQGAVASGVLDDSTPNLVNDLDIKLTKSSTDYFPWKLNVANRSGAATRNSTNDVDNFEKIEVDTPNANDVYSMSITHKGVLSGGAQNYSLVITGGVLSGLSVEEYFAGKVEIYPNPNNGNFNIRFNNNGNENVLIDIYDMSGRMVYKRDFVNEAVQFNRTINLEGVASGVYIANISKGGNISSHKIIIE